MERYTKEQRVIIVKTRYKYGENYAETVRKVRGIFGRRNAPYQSTVTVL
jgi:ribosome recycling factor